MDWSLSVHQSHLINVTLMHLNLANNGASCLLEGEHLVLVLNRMILGHDLLMYCLGHQSGLQA